MSKNEMITKIEALREWEALMEEAARKTAGVAAATVNFMTQKMIVEFEDGQDEAKVMKQVKKACKKVEPDCVIHR